MKSFTTLQYVQSQRDFKALPFLLYSQQCPFQIQPETDFLQGISRRGVSIKFCNLKNTRYK